MKQRFSSIDVKVISQELARDLVSLRIANIYDLSSRIFLFKCAKPGARQQLLVDVGFRCYITAYARTSASAPSAFVAKLRRHLKSRRITSVSQIGTDRVIEIVFSDQAYRLFLEFFAAGNLILTDKDYTVLALFRQVSEGDPNIDVKLGSTYSLIAKQNYGGVLPVSKKRIGQILSSQIARSSEVAITGGKSSKRTKGGEDLRKVLSTGLPEYPTHLLEHAFRSTGFDPSSKLQNVLKDEVQLDKLVEAITFASELFHDFESLDDSRGYIIAKRKKEFDEAASDTKPPKEQLIYDDFHPFRPSQFEGRPGVFIIEVESFNKTVDEFYSSIESQKLESRFCEREEVARRKLDSVRQEHEKRIGVLQQAQELHIRKAQAIEANTHRVAEAIAAVNGLVGQGLDWVDIGKLIENEQSRANPVAQMIRLPLKLHENTVTLLLAEASCEEESEDEGYTTVEDESGEGEDEIASKAKYSLDSCLSIDIDLALSPWANTRQYYEQKKSAAAKEQKTIQASATALKSTEKQIEADLKKSLKQEKQGLQPLRKQFWFEKFYYFISSEGYLVLGGKDASQNEMLYRRYLEKADIYVHADLQGAASVIVKNMITTPDAPIPPSTLSQAGALSVCTSSAWDSKAVMAAWWVNADQVSKTAPSGEYLATGGFMIRGKKNFLPPSQLTLGFAVMFHISDDSKTRHSRYRLHYTDSTTSSDAQALESPVRYLSLDKAGGGEYDPANVHLIPAVEGVPSSDNADIAPEPPNASKELADDETHAGAEGNNDSEGHRTEQESDSETLQINPLQPSSCRPRPRGGEQSESDSEQEASEIVDSFNHDQLSSQPNITSLATTPQPPPNDKPATLPRGKRTKARKAAKKYAHQDEEDRALAMQVLGSAKGAEKKEAALQEKAAREAKLAADKSRRRVQHAKAAQAEQARQDKMAAGDNADPGLLEQNEEILEQERTELANLDSLVGTPMPGDEILAALPVVAPWTSLGRCKYKIKLQPGSIKKGKAVKEIVGKWIEAGKMGSTVVDKNATDREKVWPREIECIKAWRVEEIAGVVPVKGVRVIESGGLGGGGGSSSVRGGRGSKKTR